MNIKLNTILENISQPLNAIEYSLNSIEETLNNSRYQMIQIPSLKTVVNLAHVIAIEFQDEQAFISISSPDVTDGYVVKDKHDIEMLKQFFYVQF